MNNFKEIAPQELAPEESSGEERINDRPLKENLSEDKYLAAVLDVFVNGRSQIDTELAQSKDNINMWQSTLNTRVATMDFAFNKLYKNGKIGEASYRRVNEKINSFKEKIEKLFVDYPEKQNPPPDDVKEFFLRELEDLALDVTEVVEINK